MSKEIPRELQALIRQSGVDPKELVDAIKIAVTLKNPSAWAEKYRILPTGPWTFTNHPYLRQIHDDLSPKVIVIKGAQLGFTETAMNRVFWATDVLKTDVMYLFPTDKDSSDFSAGRFNLALELSPKLQSLFTNVRNVGHKRAGSVNFYCRGSNSRSRLKSVPVAFLVIDEYDEMDMRNVALVRERLSGHLDKHEFNISTPTIPDFGIDEEYKRSNQMKFIVPCPHCGVREQWTWECINVGARLLQCPKCNKSISHLQKLEAMRSGEWVIFNKHSDIPGYAINQIYSPTVTTDEMVQAYEDSIDDPAAEQEFFNSKLGEAKVASGAKIGHDEMIACQDLSFSMKEGSDGATMGVDVGKELYYEIAEWLAPNFKVVVKAGTCLRFEELEDLMVRYKVYACVIDALPERRKARELQAKFPGRVWVAFYPNIHVSMQEREEMIVNVHRSESLDTTLSRVRQKAVVFPRNLPPLYYSHFEAVTRIIQKNLDGNLTSKYIEGTKPDHYLHAANYNEVAHLLRPAGNIIEIGREIQEPVVDGQFTLMEV